jgi:replication-associated recombination protein RarA
MLASFIVQAAAFDSYENARRVSCFKDTRTKLLADIEGWMKTHERGQSIYVLYGVTGIGKSTIAKTVAEQKAELNVLGASFFFLKDGKIILPDSSVSTRSL